MAVLSNNIDPDFWARIFQGDAFLSLGSILKTDIISYTPTHIWLDHEWGASVIFAFILKYFGYLGIFSFRILISLLIIIFVYKTIKMRSGKTFEFYDVIMGSAGILAMPTIFQSGLRCHFLTFLFFTVFLYILERVRLKNENGLLFILPVLMLVWANCHGGCVSGLGLIGIYFIGEALNGKPFKKYLFVLIASLGVMFINPYGIVYVKFIFTASLMPRPYITEWSSPFSSFSADFNIFKVLYVIFLITLFIKIKDYKKDFTKYILLIVCAYLSSEYIKNAPFFIITSMIFLYDNFRSNVKQVNNGFTYLTMIIIIIGLSIYAFHQNPGFNYLREQPLREIEFFKINDLKGRILCPMELGSYIAYKLFPNNLVYMDGRYEEVYFNDVKELLDKFYNVKEGWENILIEPYKPDYIIIPSDALINDYIPNNYLAVYKTEKYIIYLEKDKIKEKYYLPSNDREYYYKQAFKKGFEFQKTDKKSL